MSLVSGKISTPVADWCGPRLFVHALICHAIFETADYLMQMNVYHNIIRKVNCYDFLECICFQIFVVLNSLHTRKFFVMFVVF